MRRIAVAVGLWGLALVSHAQLTPAERQGLTDTLYIGNMTLRDLDLHPVYPADPLRFPAIQEAASQPLKAVDSLMALHATSSSRSVAQLLGHLRTKIFGDPEGSEAENSPEISFPEEVPDALRPSLKRLLVSLHYANECVKQGAANLSPEERRTLIEGLPRWATGQPSIKFEFVKQPMPSRATLLALLAKCDLKWIRYGAQFLAQDVQEELPRLRDLAPQIKLDQPLKVSINGTVVEIGGTGNDLHDSTDAALCIDFGGNDRYVGRYGAGVGYASLLIDVAGDDVYDVPDLSIGASVLGIGLAYDLGGNDTFRSRSLAFGSGLAGVGVLLKDDGSDLYESGALAQGFGFFGIGMLLDTKGDDHYSLGFMGQGAGRTQGVGWLIDKAGRDTYRSGGLIQSSLDPEWFDSKAQGWGGGESDLAGGMGLLTELAGDDVYVGGVGCQAAASDFSVGSLFDQSGADSYTASREAQACASCYSGAYLFDLAGGDNYLLRAGNGHAFGHDASAAVLLDRSGADIYAGQGDRPGVANANGVAIFLDAAGEDQYMGPPAVGNPARGSGSLAVFCDLAGMDDYADGLDNGQATAGTKWSVAYDAISYAPKPPPLDPNAPTGPPKPGSKPIQGDAEMEALLERAANGAPDVAGKALDELIAIGEPAVKWMLAKKLSTATPGQMRAIAWVSREVGGLAKKDVVTEIASPEDKRALNAILICQEAGIVEAAGSLLPALKRPVLRSVAIRTAGVLQAKECVPELLNLLSGETQSGALVSLAQIGDIRAYEKLEPFAQSEDLVDRKATIDFLGQFPDRALVTAQQLVESPSERSARIGIEILGAAGSPEALALIGKALSDPRRGVKIQAMLALDGRCPKEFRSELTELRKSVDPLVAAVAKRVDPGR